MQRAEPEVTGVPGWRLEIKLTMPIFSGLETLSARQLAAAKRHEATTRLRRAELETKNTLADREEKILVLENMQRLQKENIARAERFSVRHGAHQ
jgi:outer membrane protein TolC